MADPVESLILDLLGWIGASRPYAEVMDAWRTSCPRLPVWEEATARGLVECRRDAAGIEQVRLTAAGAARLRSRTANSLAGLGETVIPGRGVGV
jgi:D-3-phosphoglycerate dehydrogenase